MQANIRVAMVVPIAIGVIVEVELGGSS